MWKIYLEYEEEEIVYTEQNEITDELSHRSFKQFTPRHIYRNPIEGVLTKEITVDFDPSDKDIINLYCVIVSYVKEETGTSEMEPMWYIAYVSRTRREALEIKKKIDLDELEEVHGKIPQWKEKGYDYDDSDVFIIPIED